MFILSAENSPWFFIKFGTLALTSLLPTDMFADRSWDEMRKKRITPEALLSETANGWLELEPTPGGCGSETWSIFAAVQAGGCRSTVYFLWRQ